MDIDYRDLGPPQQWGYQNHCNRSTDRIMNMLTNRYIQPTNNVTPNSMPSNETNRKALNGREARNRAEKNRRDKLNSSIQELSNMVPHVAESQRRVDKTAILRYAAHWLRINYIFNSFKPNLNENGVDGFLKMMEGFFLTVTCRGEIVLVSHSIESHLGHCETDLLGQSIFNFIHPEDHAIVKKQIVPTDIDSLFDDDEDTQPRSQEEEEKIDSMLAGDKRNFTIRMARAGSRSEPTTYELVKFTGYFRRADSAPRCVKPNSSSAGFQLMRRTRLRDDGVALHTIRGNDIILNSVGVVIKQTNVCDRLIEACKYEYKTRHLIDGRIVQCDQRISLVAGFMTDEVCGLSPFTFMHRDDVRWVIVALRQMYDDSKPYGESCYRLMARNGQFIYLRTRGYLEIDNNTNRVTTFCCVNTMVAEDEGRKLIKEMKRKYSVIIKSNELAHESEVPSVENPQQIERAVLNLITNLAHNQMQETCRFVEEDISEAQNDDNDDNVSVKSGLSSCHSEMDRERKTPPLAIIAPNPNTVKSAITKSLDVIGAAIKGGAKSKSSSSSRSKSNTLSSSGISSCSNNSNGNTKRPSVLQKTPPLPQNSPTVSITTPYKSELKPNLNVIVERSISYSAAPIVEKSNEYYYYDSVNRSVDADTSMILPHEIKQEYQYPSYSSPVTDYNTSYSSYYGSDCGLTSPQYSEPSPQPQQHQMQYNDNHIHNPVQQTHPSLYNMPLNSPPLLESNKSYTTYCRSKQSPNINTGLKRSNYIDEMEDKESPKRRADSSYFSLVDDELRNMNRELTHVLPTAFEAIDRSLHDISENTEELRNSGFPTPHQNQQLNDIIEEHQEQREMLQLLQNDFNSKIQKQQLHHQQQQQHQQQQNNLSIYTNLESSSDELLEDYDSLMLNQLRGEVSGGADTDHQTTNPNVSTIVTTSPS